MKIYFAGSISSGRGDAETYREIIDYLKTKGDVLTEHIGDSSLSNNGEDVSDKYIHDRDMEWVLEADCIVAEVTIPSFGVGYEIGRALENGKKILCLRQGREKGRLSAMIAGCSDLSVEKYNDVEGVKKFVDEFINNIIKE